MLLFPFWFDIFYTTKLRSTLWGVIAAVAFTYDKNVNKVWHFVKTTVPVPKVALNPNNEHWFNSLNDNAAQSGDHPISKAA